MSCASTMIGRLARSRDWGRDWVEADLLERRDWRGPTGGFWSVDSIKRLFPRASVCSRGEAVTSLGVMLDALSMATLVDVAHGLRVKRHRSHWMVSLGEAVLCGHYGQVRCSFLPVGVWEGAM
jgi:hypothetical protein